MGPNDSDVHIGEKRNITFAMKQLYLEYKASDASKICIFKAGEAHLLVKRSKPARFQLGKMIYSNYQTKLYKIAITQTNEVKSHKYFE